MDSRKKANQQIERKKRAKRRTATAITALIIGAIVLLVVYSIWDSIDRRNILTFQGERIRTSDYSYFHLMSGAFPGDEEEREIAFSGLLRALAILERAEQRGISVPVDEMEPILESSTQRREAIAFQDASLLRGTSVNRMAQFASAGYLFEPDWMHPGPLFFLLMDEYVPYIEIDEDELAELIEENMDQFESWATTTNVKFIASDNEADLINAREAAEMGYYTFDQLIERYHQVEEDDELINPMELTHFAINSGAFEQWQELTMMEEGELSEVFQAGDRMFLVQIYEREVDEEILADILEETREEFIDERRVLAFFDVIDSWVAQASVSRNERALRRF